MKFVLETGSKLLIHSYDIGSISISGINPDNQQLKSTGENDKWDEWDADSHLAIYRKSVILRTNGMVKNWLPQNKSEFMPEHFQIFTELQPEIVIIGTGNQLSFPSPDCLSIFQQNNLGYEIMNTAAACRTFNVLAAEDRDVALALLMIEQN